MLKKLNLYFQTLRHLKWTQIRYRIYYAIINRIRKNKVFDQNYTFSLNKDLQLLPSIPSLAYYSPNHTFQFLNLKKSFHDRIDWNYPEYGKLWTYNLNYFEFLGQADLSKDQKLALISDFIAQEKQLKDALEPFPISLRVIFWIKFLVEHKIENSEINDSLFRQLQLLTQKIEYHLLGNHLLENAFALLFGAYYFSDKSLFQKAEHLLQQELKEQILSDGAHFELSPMYHQLMLYRLLDSINLIQNNPSVFSSSSLLSLCQQQAKIMLGWLEQITFADGSIPLVNDSAPNIAPSTVQLMAYADRLSLAAILKPLQACGYRKYQRADYEFLADVGAIGPDYIPGHAHSDTFNFVLHFQGQPLIVDTGISTYEKNEKRQQERSTSAHNTVQWNDTEQSEIWGGFRVARRARIIDCTEKENELQASHNGYHHRGVIHQRTFKLGEKQIEIIDNLTGSQTSKAFLHFHPDIQLQLKDQMIHGAFGAIEFTNVQDIFLETYMLATGFNQTIEAMRAVVLFQGELHTKITF